MTGYYDLELFRILMVTGIVFIGIIVIAGILDKTKTRKYRERIVDLYVAGKTRLLASKESIDLNKEFENFLVSEKNDRRMSKEFRLDQAIEDELIENINKETKK